MQHLKPKGRAGVIVPEGIIFISGKGHTQLRKNLLADGLWAVASLPSGVFNPDSAILDCNQRKKIQEKVGEILCLLPTA